MKKVYYHVVSNLARLNAIKLVAKGQTVHKYMSGNVYFAKPSVSMDDFAAALQLLEQAISNAAYADRAMIAKRDAQATIVADMLRSLASYVDAEAKGDRDIILSSGFEVRSEPTKSGEPTAPAKLEVVLGNISGTATFKCKREKNVHTYVGEWKQEDATEWQTVLSTGCKIKLEGLMPLTNYTFRIAAVNSKGQSNWSEALTALVL
jgi:maltooligosyltrehalose synthase